VSVEDPVSATHIAAINQGGVMSSLNVSSAALAAFILSTAFAAEAGAACFTKEVKSALGRPPAGFDRASALLLSGDDEREAQVSIVGLWRVAFLVGDGPTAAYEGFQHWHAGGTEVMVDNGVPPALGNVCVGVWKQAGPRTFRLRHVTFNWDANGKSTGTFQVLITVRVNRAGTSYSGTYESDSFDLEGNVIPELHAEGRLRGQRLSVE
jgi:hypothetical protein